MSAIRTNVVFRCPAEFVPLSFDDGVLSTVGAQWFVTLLSRVDDLVIEEPLCQEDWGVVAFARRGKKRFWIGLSSWPDGEQKWLAHFHHGSFAWLHKFSSSSRGELLNLLNDFHQMLKSDPSVSEIVWHHESQMSRPAPEPFPTPVDD